MPRLWPALLAGSVAASSACSRERPAARTSTTEQPPTQIHVTGDVYFGEAYRLPIGTSPDERYLRPLAKLRPVFAGSPIVANLESAFASAESVGLAHKDYLHWSHSEHTARALAEHGFVGVSLSNNHAMDFGLDALQTTRAALTQHGIACFGAGANADEARAPLALSIGPDDDRIGLAMIGAYWYRPHYDRAYRFYAGPTAGGVRALVVDEVAAQIREAKERDPSQGVIVFPHWGRNYRWRNREQRRLARALVDAGADLVIGHGAHAFQEVESYRGRFILYGLGNLVFLTPGRFRDFDAPPYGVLATVRWPEGSAGEAELVLRFIASDNERTGYQPHILHGSEFTSALATLRHHSCEQEHELCADAALASDEHGPLVRLPLARWPRLAPHKR